jgi:hypothetical protein
MLRWEVDSSPDRVAAVGRQFQADHRAHAQAIREAIERLGGRAFDHRGAADSGQSPSG